MGLQNDVFAAHAAPAASVAFARLDKINRTLIFRSPGTLYYLILRLIHLNETARRQDWIHGEILRTHVAVGKGAGGKLREVGKRDQSPLLDHAAKVGGAAFVESRIHAQRNLH